MSGKLKTRTGCCKNGHPWIPENLYSYPNGYVVCRPCSRERNNRWRKTHPVQYRAHVRKWNGSDGSREASWRSQGILDFTVEEYNRLLTEQKGLCAICHLPPDSRPLFPDHDHKTGKVRELVCMKCNAILGMADDNLALLEAALQYLRKHSL